MNILHLKYAVEVEKTASITKAADNLFMGQPNLSRSIRELEESIGIKIFKRTAKGIVPTDQGKEILNEAKIILSKINNIETAYKKDEVRRMYLTVSAPRLKYITQAFAKTILEFDNNKGYDVNYIETGPYQAIDNIFHGIRKIAVIRVEEQYLSNLISYIYHKEFEYEEVARVEASMVMSARLSDQQEYTFEEFDEFTEIYFGGIYYPQSVFKQKSDECITSIKKRIKVYDRRCAKEFLDEIPNSYLWSTDINDRTIQNKSKFKLINIDGVEKLKYVDVVIWNKTHILTYEERLFIDNLKETEK